MARKVKVNMEGVESFVRCEEGEHIVKLTKIDEKTAETGNDMLVATFEVTKGSSAGAKIYENFVLSEKALWKLKGYLEAVGMKADGKIVLDLDKLVGKTCIVSVIHEEYKGAIKARIDSFKSLAAKAKDEDDDYEEPEDEDYEEDEDEEEEEKPKKKPKKDKEKKKDKPKKEEKKKPKKKDEDDDDEDDEDDDEDWEDD